MDLVIRIVADWLVVAVVLVGGIGVVVLTKKERFKTFAKMATTGLVALLLAKIASLFYQGDRPFVLLGEAPKAAFLNNPGFPSDHALLVFTVTLLVWASTKNKPLSLTLLVMSILVSIGRVIALVHTPIDVLGGALCAVLAVVIMYGVNIFRASKT